MRHATLSPVLCIVAATLFGACGTQNGSGFLDGSDGGSGGASSGTGSIGGGKGGTHDCTDKTAGDQQGCGCADPSRACWTVPGEMRNKNGCADGVQKCEKSGEFSSWGACTGEQTACVPHGGGTSGGDPGSSGDTGDGTGDGGKGSGEEAGPPGCVCEPGAVRWCDTPIACNWGKQQCKPDGHWGPCNETPDRPPGCNDPTDPSYDEDCCVKAGQCCQDFLGFDDDKSIGKCDGIACPGQFIPR